MPEPREGDPLTERDVLILQWIADGLTFGQISRRTFLHVNTIAKIVMRVRTKLGAATTSNAVHIADVLGIIKP